MFFFSQIISVCNNLCIYIYEKFFIGKILLFRLFRMPVYNYNLNKKN